MLIEYRMLGVEFRNYKLLSTFTGILMGLLGLQHLDTFPWGLKREGMRIMQECKLTGGRGCQTNVQMVVSSWQRTVGRRVVARGCLWHTASIWRWGHRKSMHPHNTTATLITDDNPTSPLYIWFISPPSIQEDNRTVKIKPVCSPAAGASLFVLWMWTAQGLW